jgi:hypothetical protein
MKLIVAGIFFTMIFCVYGQRTCRKITCLEKGDFCATVDNLEAKLAPCPDVNDTCYFDNGYGGSYKCKPKVQKYLPGEYCGQECVLCISGMSKNDICLGKNETNDCSRTEECNPGLFCSLGKCKNLTKAGEVCNRTILCSPTSVCAKGICTTIGSLGNNNNSDVHEACKSFYSDGTVCVDAPKLYNDSCQSTDHCTHNRSGEMLTIKCKCGWTDSTSAICPSARGDVNANDVRVSFNVLVFRIY